MGYKELFYLLAYRSAWTPVITPFRRLKNIRHPARDLCLQFGTHYYGQPAFRKISTSRLIISVHVASCIKATNSALIRSLTASMILDGSYFSIDCSITPPVAATPLPI